MTSITAAEFAADQFAADGATTISHQTTPELTSNRDRLAGGTVLGFMSAGWFGWALGGPGIAAISIPGMILGVLLGIASITMHLRAPGVGTNALKPNGHRTLNIWILFELALIVPALPILNMMNAAQYFAAWTLMVVGVHFFPLARFYQLRSLVVATVCCVLAGLVAIVLGRAGIAAPVAVAGTLGGLTMLGVSLLGVIRGLQIKRDAAA